MNAQKSAEEIARQTSAVADALLNGLLAFLGGETFVWASPSLSVGMTDYMMRHEHQDNRE